MKDNKICPNCGANNKNDYLFCANCGTKLESNSVPTTDKSEQSINNNTGGNIFGILALVFFFAGSTIFAFIDSVLPTIELQNKFSSIIGLTPLIGIVLMIIGRIKYQNNKFLKVVMWIIIGSIILGIILGIILIIYCYVTCANTDWSGFG